MVVGFDSFVVVVVAAEVEGAVAVVGAAVDLTSPVRFCSATGVEFCNAAATVVMILLV